MSCLNLGEPERGRGGGRSRTRGAGLAGSLEVFPVHPQSFLELMTDLSLGKSTLRSNLVLSCCIC